MKNIIIVLIGISALGFVLAIISTLLGGKFVGVSAEAYSRASNNLALITIALVLWFSVKNEKCT